MTDVILTEAANYLTSGFFQSHFSAFSFGPGPYLFVVQNGSLYARVGNSLIAKYSLSLQQGQAYYFYIANVPENGSNNLAIFNVSGASIQGQQQQNNNNGNNNGNNGPPTFMSCMPGNIYCEPLFISNSGQGWTSVFWKITAPVGQYTYTLGNILGSGGNITITDVSIPATDPTTVAAESWYNRAPYHSQPEGINILGNVILKNFLNDSTARIYTYNNPLPLTATQQQNAVLADQTGFFLALLLIFGFSICLATFAVFLVSERTTRAKHVQFVSGANYVTFWAGTFLWDMINMSLCAITIVVVFAIFNLAAFQGINLAVIFLLLILLAWSMLPLIYILSLVFENGTSAFVKLVMGLFFTSFAMLMAVTFVSLVYKNTGAILHYAFYVNPLFAFAQGISDVYTNYQYASFCATSATNCSLVPTTVLAWAFPGVGKNCVFMAGGGFVWFVILFTAEYLKIDFSSKITPKKNLFEMEDTDVLTERTRVEGGRSNDMVIVDRIFKQFGTKKPSVNNLSFGIAAGECFGLLGNFINVCVIF